MTQQAAGLSRTGAKLSGIILNGDRALIVLAMFISWRVPDLLWNHFGMRAAGAVLAGVILLAMLLRSIATGWRPTGYKGPMALIGFYLVVCVICTTQANDAHEARRMIIEVAKGAMVMFLVIGLCQTMRSLHRLIAAMLFAGLVMCTISVLQQWTGTLDQSYGYFGHVVYKAFPDGYHINRSVSVVGDPNYLAQVIIVLIPLSIVGLWRARKPIEIVFMFWVGLACLLTVMFTYSRGGLITMLAAFAMLGVLAVKARPRRSAVGLTCALLIAAALLMPNHYATRMSTFGSFLPQDGQWRPTEQLAQEVGLRGRLSAAIVGLKMFRDHPLLGVGPYNFRVHYLAYAQELEIDPNKNIVRVAHNHYLAVAAETGLLGIAAFGAFLIGFCRRMHVAQKKFIQAGMTDPALVITAVSIAVYSFLISSLFLDAGHTFHLWLLAGIAFALPGIADREIARDAAPSPVVAEADES